MIRYNWKKLKKYKIPVILDVLIIDELQGTKYITPKLKEAILDTVGGVSFLKNPKGLVEAKGQLSDTEIFYYLELAAERSFLDYKTTGSLTLPINYIKAREDLDIKQLKFNRGLIVTNESISFVYEEI